MSGFYNNARIPNSVLITTTETAISVDGRLQPNYMFIIDYSTSGFYNIVRTPNSGLATMESASSVDGRLQPHSMLIL